MDTYQGPYKTRLYNWIGLQLLIRVILFGISSLDRNLSLTISITLFSLTGGIQAALKPKFKEQAFVMNITILYAFLLYSQEVIDVMVVNIMIAVAALHFVLIIIYHITTYVCSSVIREKIMPRIAPITKWITILLKKPQNNNQFELQDNVRSTIPEAVNYHEFREPLLNQV